MMPLIFFNELMRYSIAYMDAGSYPQCNVQKCYWILHSTVWNQICNELIFEVVKQLCFPISGAVALVR